MKQVTIAKIKTANGEYPIYGYAPEVGEEFILEDRHEGMTYTTKLKCLEFPNSKCYCSDYCNFYCENKECGYTLVCNKHIRDDGKEVYFAKIEEE